MFTVAQNGVVMAYANKEKQRAQARRAYVKNRAKVILRTAAYQRTAKYKAWARKHNHDPATWARRACYQAKYKARELNVAFDMRPEDLQLPTVCPFTLLPFDFGPKNGKAGPQSPSVDRIKPDRGYVRGNVRVISLQANAAKSNITDPAIFDRLAEDARLWGLV
jgi:hypothetical protein